MCSLTIECVLLLYVFSYLGLHFVTLPHDGFHYNKGVEGSALTRGARTHAALAPLSLSLSPPVWTAVGWTWTLLPNKARARALSPPQVIPLIPPAQPGKLFGYLSLIAAREH